MGDQTGESGIASVGGLEQYFKDKYGEIMTDECIESMIDNRTIIQCMQLAEKYNSDIVSKRHLAHQKGRCSRRIHI